MSAVRSNSYSGSSFIDDLLKSTSWASSSITFSFPQNAASYGTNYGRGEAQGFSVMNAAQQIATREAFTAWSDIASIRFTEVSGSDAAIRLGVSSLPSTAWAYAPSNNASGGDVWIGKAAYNVQPELGNYGWMAILHEIGHALGLAHPHEGTQSSGYTAALAEANTSEGSCTCCAGSLHSQLPALSAPKQDQAAVLDAMPYSVMSYRSFLGAEIGEGYKNELSSFAQSPMARDIAAIQHLYGANYQTRSGDTRYQWSEITGERSVDGAGAVTPTANIVFETVWDGGGTDTFDLTNFSNGVTVDLRPGQWTDFGSGQLANLGEGHSAPGNVAVAYLHADDPRSLIENVVGGAGNDIIAGNSADNLLVGGSGDDALFGFDGNNILVGDGVGAELSFLGITASAFTGSILSKRAGDDRLVGGASNDIFIPGFGDDLVEGSAGADTLALDMAFSDLTVREAGGAFIFTGAGFQVEAHNIELLALRDGIYSLAGQLPVPDMKVQTIILLYQASLGRDADPQGLEFWLGEVSERNMIGMAQSMIGSNEFSERFGDQNTLSPDAFVAALYENVLNRDAAVSEAVYWIDQLKSGVDRAEVLLAFAQSDENRANLSDPVAALGENIDLVAISQAQWAQYWH